MIYRGSSIAMEDVLEKKLPGDEWRWMREPAIFCDAYSLQVWTFSNTVRFAFGEYTDEDTFPFYRVGVVMPLSDAKQLYLSLGRALKDAEREPEVRQDLEEKSDTP